jgi:hypothetical protein
VTAIKNIFSKVFKIVVFFAAVLFFNGYGNENKSGFIIEQTALNSNNINAYITNTGIIDQNILSTSTPGFEWPKDSGKFAIYSAGLTIAAYVNNQLRMAAASWKGEYAPGYIIDSSGYPRARTNSSFKLYSVRRTDNWINNPDWLNWGVMVPYGAPFMDANSNGTYEYMIDTPGVRGAAQTVFTVLTDGFPETHTTGEGFGGGTPPLYAELRITAWTYDNPGYQDMQFVRWVVINRNNTAWDNTYFTLVVDPDLGEAADDYIGCDTLRNLMYCYNSDNYDEGSLYSYGYNPPAVGMYICKSAVNKNITPPAELGISSMTQFRKNIPNPECEAEPYGDPVSAYNFMKGFKRDGTPWVIPGTSPPQTTKFCYSGDPENGTGWTEYTGSIYNCGNNLYGQWVSPDPPEDKRFLISSGADNFSVNPGDTQTIIIAQLIARGTNHKNSVTKLKELTQNAVDMCNNGFVIGINPVISEVPQNFILYQNYPNPFNPVTTIKFDIPNTPLSSVREWQGVRLIIYDILGREISVLVDEKLKPALYRVNWDASGYSSGVYYYRLNSGDYSQTRKMVLIK